MVEAYLGLIYKEAWTCYRKLLGCGITTYELDDLVQDGVVTFYNILQKYDASRAKVSTLLTIVLRNSYANVLKAEVKRGLRHVELEEQEFPYQQDMDSKVLFEQLEHKLSNEAKQIVRCILGLDADYVRWQEKRDWAKRNLKLRYRRKNTKLILESFLNRSVDSEFSELSSILG